MTATPLGAALPPDRPLAGPRVGAREGQTGVEALHATGFAIVAEPDRRELARALAQPLAQALRADIVYVVALTDGQVTAAAGWRHGVGTAAVVADDPALRVALAVANRCDVARLAQPADRLPGDVGALGDLGWHNLLAVPALHHQGHAVAVLLAANKRGPGGFLQADVRLAEAVALQASVGFDRAHLLAQLEEWGRGMEALLAFSAAVNRHQPPPTLVREMVEHSARFLGADGGRGGLVETDGATDWMESSARFQEGRWVEEARRWGRNEGIPGFVLENEFPYLAATYDTDRLAEAALATGHGVRYALCVPIKDSDHRVLGFFELFRGAAAAPFTWQDAAFLESLASTTAVALENATLLRELAAKHEEVKLLSAGHIEMLEAERRHIARELHDESGQALVGIKLALQVMARHVGDGNPALREQLDHVRSEVNAATTRLKQIARRLRPPALDSLGLHPAIAQLAQDVGERGGLSTAVDLAWLPERLSSELETALFRIAQEAFTNVVRHAEARQASLTMGACEGFVRLRIHDDGRGFDPTATTGGLGLLGIRERVDNLGGFFRVESAPGAGTSLLVELPL